MNKLIDLIKVCAILTYLLCGCSRELVGGRKYIIEEVRGLQTVTFKNVRGEYHFPDSAKVGDTVLIRRTYNINKANIW